MCFTLTSTFCLVLSLEVGYRLNVKMWRCLLKSKQPSLERHNNKLQPKKFYKIGHSCGSSTYLMQISKPTGLLRVGIPKTSYKNWLQLLMNFLKNILQITFVLILRFLQISYKFLKNFLRISLEFLLNFFRTF